MLDFQNALCVSSPQVFKFDVFSEIWWLDSSKPKGCGPDIIPPTVLKQCALLISEGITDLLNASCRTGILYLRYVDSIVKSGSKNDVKQIVVQSALAKLFEMIVLNKILPILSSIISTEQHGSSLVNPQLQIWSHFNTI